MLHFDIESQYHYTKFQPFVNRVLFAGIQGMGKLAVKKPSIKYYEIFLHHG